MSADLFINHFSSIGNNTVSHLQNSEIEYFLWNVPKCTHKFNLTDITEVDVRKHFKALGVNNANDILGFDCKLLRLSADVISPIFTRCV